MKDLAFDPHWEMLLQLLIGAAIGGIVGYEREREGKPAGIRTHAMVSLGATLFTLVSIHGFGATAAPAQVAAQIVSGIGFVGAGAILHDRFAVHGLTTAASLWVSAAIGMAVGTGMVVMSVAAGLIVLALLWFGPGAR